MLTEVRLYGHLGERFGKVHHFAVHSAAQAMRALEVNLPGFRQYMLENSEPGYYIINGKNQGLSEEELGLTRRLSVLKIVPGVQGRKAAGGFQMILGAVLMVVGVALAFVPGLLTSPIPGFVFKMGAMMFIGGLAQYLAPQPRMGENNKADQPRSYAFDGPENTVGQGGPVRVVYGLLGVGSTVGAMALYAEDVTAIFGGGGANDDPTAPGFHIWSPSSEVILTIADPANPTVAWPTTVIEAVNGVGPYTYTVVEESGTFERSADHRHLKTVDPSGLLPQGSWSVDIEAEDSTGQTCQKTISIVARFDPDGSYSSSF